MISEIYAMRVIADENTILMSRFSMFREVALTWIHIMVLTEYVEWED